MPAMYLWNGRIILAVKLFPPERASGVGVLFPHGWAGAHPFDDPHGFLASSGVTVAPMEQ